MSAPAPRRVPVLVALTTRERGCLCVRTTSFEVATGAELVELQMIAGGHTVIKLTEGNPHLVWAQQLHQVDAGNCQARHPDVAPTPAAHCKVCAPAPLHLVDEG